MTEIVDFFDWESSPSSARWGEDGECTESSGEGGEWGLAENESDNVESEEPQDNADQGDSVSENRDGSEGRGEYRSDYGSEVEDGDEDGGEDEDGGKVSRKRVRRSSFSQTPVSTISGDETDTSLPRVIKRVRSAMASGTAHSPIRIDSPRKYI